MNLSGHEKPMTPARWQHLMQTLHLPPNVATYDALCAAYAERHRHHHTGEPIHDCLEPATLSTSRPRKHVHAGGNLMPRVNTASVRLLG